MKNKSCKSNMHEYFCSINEVFLENTVRKALYVTILSYPGN